jgi:hypothetical protein
MAEGSGGRNQFYLGRSARGGEANGMKKVIQIALDDNQVIELAAILIDDDEQEALKFLKEHFKGKVRALLESG